ncbi:hypothetical protein NKH18_01490 [Streptomyces sp. M10(2022)]
MTTDRSYVSRMLSGERRATLRHVKLIAEKCGGDTDLVVLLWEIAAGVQNSTVEPAHTLRAYLRACATPPGPLATSRSSPPLSTRSRPPRSSGRSTAPGAEVGGRAPAGDCPAEPARDRSAALGPGPVEHSGLHQQLSRRRLRVITTGRRRTMKPAPPAVLTNAFYAFYDLHRPAYEAYAAALLTPEEARLAVSHLFDLVAGNWTTVVSERHPQPGPGSGTLTPLPAGAAIRFPRSRTSPPLRHTAAEQRSDRHGDRHGAGGRHRPSGRR